MAITDKSYGWLYNDDIKIYRDYFEEMVEMLGIQVIYRAPRPGKKFDGHGELDTFYYEPICIGCIFNEHPDQKTLKKQGWVAELQDGSSMVHLAYDTPHLEVGALITVPSGIDGAVGRVFRIIAMQNIMIYPASIACEIAPEYIDVSEKSEVRDFTKDNFTKLVDNEEDD